MNSLYTYIVLLVIIFCCQNSHAQIKGSVFRDFDLNGVQSDTLPIEPGVSGVRVRAFVDLNKTFIQTITDNNGNYSFSSIDIPVGKSVRIEFDQLPTGDYNGPYGAGSGTTVQFVKAPAEQVNLGINYPADYCQKTGIRLVVPCYINGNTQTTIDADGNPVADELLAAKGDALVSLDYTANGVAGAANFPPDHLATGGEVGAVWGLAYQRRSKTVFSAATVKRHMSFGPLGTGGIYLTNMNTKITTNFLNVKSLGIDTGDDPHSGLLADKTQASADPGPMTAMGRLSIGGMDMAEDDKTLYFINLKDRQVYGVLINSPAVAPTSSTAVKSWSIPDPGCSNGDFRPWAIKVYHGKIYVGVVCSAETSQQQSDLKAFVYRFDPTEASPVFTEVLSFPLDFRRGPTDLTSDPAHLEASCTQYDHWLPWNDSWPTPCGLGINPTFVMYPQPILTALEFDDDGSMLIGFMDRFGNLSGVANHNPEGNGFYDGFTGGDLLRAYNNHGTFELEKNGKSGSLSGSGIGNNEGPVDANNLGGEFFGKDNWFFIDHIGHAEVAGGGITFVPGYNEVLTTAYDPIANIYQSGGLKVFNTKNGSDNRDYVLYTRSSNPGSFGKASGLGDVKALCDPGPIELGNRLWFDDNRDGIQDPYEPGIDGIVLSLYDMENGGVSIATQTTHDGGQFYFNNSTVPGGLQYNHRYEIRMDTVQLRQFDITLAGAKRQAAPGGRLAGARLKATALQRQYWLSPANRTGLDAPDLRDSDAQLAGGSAVIAVTTLDAGQNDFTNDFSVYSCPALTNEKDTISLCQGSRLDSISAIGTYFSRVDSVRFVLFSSPQSGTAMYENTGIVLGTMKPDSLTNRVVLPAPLLNTATNQPTTVNQYIYAIIYPTPENPACRQWGETVVRIAPALVAEATGGTLTCSQKAVQLTAKARYRDESMASNVTYTWVGPGGFTSSEQSPSVSTPGTYTLTVNDLTCVGNFTTTTTDVKSDTAVPALKTSVVAKLCATCTATISAESSSNSLTWTGPNGFSAIGTGADVTEEGTYTVTSMGVNGCMISANLQVTGFTCPPPKCSPITIRRTK